MTPTLWLALVVAFLMVASAILIGVLVRAAEKMHDAWYAACGGDVEADDSDGEEWLEETSLRG